MSLADVAVLDCHHHYGTLLLSVGSRAGSLEAAREAADERSTRISRMDRAGIDAAVIMPVNRYLRPNGVPDTQAVNNGIAAYRDSDPEHFPIAVGITEPMYGEQGLEEIARVDEELGLVGISYHTRWQGVATDDPWVLRGLEEMHKRRLLPFIHSWHDSALESPVMVETLLAAFPDMPFIVTDALSSHAQQGHYLSIAKRFDNVYFDTSCAYNAGIFSHWIEDVGAERLIFGTDCYSAHMVSMHLPSIWRGLGLRDADLQLVFKGNLIRLLEWTGRISAA